MEKVDFCSHEELELLLQAARNPRHRAMILLLGEAGLKVSEMLGLTWQAFDFRTRALTVTGRRKKAAIMRQVPVSERLVAVLTDLLQAEPPKDKTAYLFESASKPGEPIGRAAVNNMLTKLRAQQPATGGASGKLNPNKLRETFTATLQAAGTAPEVIQQALGQQTLPPRLRVGPPNVEELRQQLGAGRPKPTWRQRLGRLFLRTQRHRLGAAWAGLPQSRQLVGRDAEAARIQELVAKRVSVLLVGPMGVGKSKLLDALTFELPVLVLEDTQQFKKSLAGLLLYLFDGDKERARALFYPDRREEGKLEAQINKETIPGICKILCTICEPREYILKINDLDAITPSVVKALELLKDHFVIVTTSRGVKAANAGFIWNFERVELRNLNRAHTLRLAHQLTEQLEPEDRQYLGNKVWDTSEGNPRMVQELCGRFALEPVLDNEAVADICTNYIGKQTREIDMSIFLLVLFGGLSLLRYMSRESHNTSLRFIGGVAMVLLMFGRYFFNSARRKSF